MKSLIYTVSLPLAALLGFAVHRASLCTVRTIAEIFSTRKAYMMAAMLKAVLWVMAVSVPILLFLPGTATPNRSYAITVAAITGGFLFCGMLLSAWQRGSLRLRWRRIQTWPRHLIGGTLMGAGAVLIPGGNDTLMLKSLPGLSPHAIPAFVALLFGIGVTLLFMRLLTGKSLKVVCTNDICQTEN